jgi:hypothetical protein
LKNGAYVTKINVSAPVEKRTTHANTRRILGTALGSKCFWGSFRVRQLGLSRGQPVGPSWRPVPGSLFRHRAGTLSTGQTGDDGTFGGSFGQFNPALGTLQAVTLNFSDNLDLFTTISTDTDRHPSPRRLLCSVQALPKRHSCAGANSRKWRGADKQFQSISLNPTSESPLEALGLVREASQRCRGSEYP